MLTSSQGSPVSALPALHYRTDDRLQALRQMVLDTLPSPASKRAYGWGLDQFFAWRESAGSPHFTRSSIMQFRTHCEERSWSTSSINLALSSLRKLASEAAENGIILAETATAIGKIKGVKRLGIRQGNWLTRDQAQELLRRPDASTLKGARDQAILAVLVGTAIRRQELARLTLEHLQQREGRWVILDLEGKGRRIRTVAVPAWVKASIDRWTTAAEITGGGRIFRRMRKGDHVDGESMSADAVWGIVRKYAAECGVKLSPHDCRRTCAKLARLGGADLDQIQYMLGHSDVATTQRYLGDMQNLADAPNDKLGLQL